MSKKRGNYLLLGTFIGFILGLFFAPKKGSELREDAKEKISDLRENPTDVLRGTVSEMKERLNKMIDENSEVGNIDILEDEIVISRTFEDNGENN